MSIVGTVQTGCCSAGGRLELGSEAQWVFSFLYTGFFSFIVSTYRPQGKWGQDFPAWELQSILICRPQALFKFKTFVNVIQIHLGFPIWPVFTMAGRAPWWHCHWEGWDKEGSTSGPARMRVTHFIPSGSPSSVLGAGYWLALSLVMFTVHDKDLQAVRDVWLSRLTAECFCLWNSCGKGDGLGKIML